MKEDRRHEKARIRMVLIIIGVMAVLVIDFGAKKLLLG